jgi:hypothetical protein
MAFHPLCKILEALLAWTGGGTAAGATAAHQTDGLQIAKAYGKRCDGAQVQLCVNGNGEVIILDAEDEAIRQGKHWGFNGHASGIGAGGIHEWLLKVGTNPINLQYEIESNGAGGLWEIFASPTTTADGTPLICWPTNATLPAVTTTTMTYDTPTVTADGTSRVKYIQGSTGLLTRIGGSGSTRRRVVLAPGAVVLARFTATGAATSAGIRLNLWEE